MAAHGLEPSLTGLPSSVPAWQDVDPAIDDICRVCRGEGSTEHPLFHPCRCSGSIRYVHEDCLLQWLNHSNRHYCELCQHRFTFRPIYAPNTPTRLPPFMLLRGVKKRIVQCFKKIIHGLLVGAVWLILLPNYCARVENLLFREEGYMTAVQRLLWIGYSPNPLADIGEGVVIMGMTMVILFSFVFLRDEVLHNGWNPPWIVLPQAPAAAHAPAPVAVPVADQGAGPPDGEAANAGANAGANAEQINDQNPEAGVQGNGQPDQAVPDNPPAPAPAAPAAPAANANAEPNIDLGGAFGEDIALGHIVGLDGTYAFLEYAFWFSVLCTAFVTVFYLLPFICGRAVVHDLLPGVLALGFKVLNAAPMSANITVNYVGLHERIGAFIELCQYKTVIYLYFGYIAFAFCFSQTYEILGKDYFYLRAVPYFRRLGNPNVKFAVGLFYLATKTGVLFFTEAVVFPAFFGGLADFSCMEMLNASVADRWRSFETAPGTFVFLHWILGVLFISYFVWFVLLTRETLRPGLLWFVRSYQESNPFKELVMWPIGKSLRNLTFVLLLFIVVIVVTIYLPVRFLCRFLKGFFPYNLALLEESPIGELTIQFAILHYIGPSLFQQTTLRSFAKWVIVTWAEFVGQILDMRSYLLGDQQPVVQNNANVNNVNNDGDLGVAHDQLDMMLVNAPNRPAQPYQKPKHFTGRLIFLLLLLAFTGMMISALLLTVPVSLGRLVLGFWFGARPVHDIYTLFTGLFTLAIGFKGIRAVNRTLRNSVRVSGVRWRFWSIIVLKGIAACVLVVLWLPLLIGLTFEVTLLKPVALFFDQSSIFQIYRCFVFGALIVKIVLTFCIVAMAENNRWKQALEQVYANGFRNMNLTFLWKSFIWPITAPLLFYLAFPFFLVRTWNLMSGDESAAIDDHFKAYAIEALAHVVFLGILVSVFGILASLGYFKILHDQIKDELFLVGKRLVNYDHKPPAAAPIPIPSPAAEPPAEPEAAVPIEANE